MFKLPLEDTNVSGCVCDIAAESQRVKVLRKSDLIIWYELPMTQSFSVEALDKALHITQTNRLFGSKPTLLSGNWRQTGPIVRFGSDQDSVEAALISSPHRQHVRPSISPHSFTTR